MKSTKVPSIDSLKFVCALMVVCIHVFFFINPYVNQIYLIAVPIFYMITGYFLLADIQERSIQRIKKNLIKVVKLTVMANLIYVVGKYLLFGQYHYNILELLLFGDAIAGQLWYLTALIEGLLVVWLIKRIGLFKVIPYLIIGGLLLNFTLGAYSPLFFSTPPHLPRVLTPFQIDINRNFLTTALPFLFIGGWMHTLSKINILQAILWTAVFAVLSTIELNYVMNITHSAIINGGLLISSVFLSIAVMQLFIKLPSSTWFIRKTAELGRKYSLDIYIYHILIFYILNSVMELMPFNLRWQSIWYVPLVVLLTIAFSWVLNNTVRKWLRDRSNAVG